MPKVFDTLNQHSVIVDLDSYVFFFVIENQRSAVTEKLLVIENKLGLN